jgi:large subunit ribosomal protein L29
MTILRSQELSELSADELDDRLVELRRELMKIKGVLASGGIPEEVGKTREIKRTIARILTYKKNLSKKEDKKQKQQKKSRS